MGDLEMKKAESRESTERCDGLSDGALNEYEHREKGRREGAGEEDEDTEKVGGGGGFLVFLPSLFHVCQT